MFSKVKHIFANCSGIPAAVNWRNRRRLLVVTYHGIYDGPKGKVPMPETFVHVADMLNHLSFITQKYRLIGPDMLLRYMEGKGHIPKNAAMITFDDGYESFHRLALPALCSLRIQPVVFISTSYVEERKPFWFDAVWWLLNYGSTAKKKSVQEFLGMRSCEGNAGVKECLAKMKNLPLMRRNIIMNEVEAWLIEAEKNDPRIKLFYGLTRSQVRAAEARGVRIGGHTHSHTILANLSDKDAEEEIVQNKNSLEKITGSESVYFAYPNGGKTDFSDNHKIMLKRAGYRIGFSLTEGRSLPRLDPMSIARVNVGPCDNLRSLQLRCSGVIPWIAEIRNLLRVGRQGSQSV